MKSLHELNELRDKSKAAMDSKTRILVGIATCGNAAGAKPVFEAFENEIKKTGASNVEVVKTGCVGMCKYEPIAEIIAPGKDKVTYVKLTADMVSKIVSDHVLNGQVVSEYTIGNYTN